ncbi:MAG: hypothetical protein AAF830_15910 [Pseudomonadota bacterium]
MFGRASLVGAVWIVFGSPLAFMALNADNQLPYLIALGTLFIVVATFGNYYAFFGFGTAEEQRRPSGRTPFLRKIYLWMAPLMFIALAMTFPIQVFAAEALPMPSPDAPLTALLPWMTLLSASVALLGSAIFIFMRSKHAVIGALGGALLLVATDALAYGIGPRAFPPILEASELPFWFLGAALVPFIVMLTLFRIGGDLR